MKKTIRGVVLRKYKDCWKAVIDDVPVVFYPMMSGTKISGWVCRPRPAFYETKTIAYKKTLVESVKEAAKYIEADL